MSVTRGKHGSGGFLELRGLNLWAQASDLNCAVGFINARTKFGRRFLEKLRSHGFGNAALALGSDRCDLGMRSKRVRLEQANDLQLNNFSKITSNPNFHIYHIKTIIIDITIIFTSSSNCLDITELSDKLRFPISQPTKLNTNYRGNLITT